MMSMKSVTDLDQEYLEQLARLRPEVCLDLGSKLPSGELIPVTHEVRHDYIQRAKEWLAARTTLTQQQQNVEPSSSIELDTQILEHATDYLSFSQLDLAHQETDPDLISAPILMLTRIAFDQSSSADERYLNVSQGLRSLGTYLNKAREEVLSPDPILAEHAKHLCSCAQRFLQDLSAKVAQLTDHGLSTNVEREIQQAIPSADEALSLQQQWLSELETVNTSACTGADQYHELLKKRLLETNPSAILELSKSQIEAMRLENVRIRKRAFARATVDDLWSEVCAKESPLSVDEVIAWLGELSEQVADFCLDSGQFPAMSNDQVHLETVPASLRDIIGHYHLSRPTFSNLKRSDFLISNPVDDPSLQYFCVAELERIAAAEFYPGTHLFGVLSTQMNSIARLGVPSGFLGSASQLWATETTDGWAHFAEETMRELQFRDSPSSRLMIIRQVLIRSLQAWYDVSIHSKQTSPEEAIAGLQIHAGLSKQEARRSVIGILKEPSRAINHLHGKTAIQKLKRSTLKHWKGSYSDRGFHTFVLQAGAVPLRFLPSLLEEYSRFTASEGTMDHNITDLR